MGMPQNWHRRQALMFASQLPENQADAHLIIQAMTELVDTFLSRTSGEDTRPNNVLPFGTAG